MRVVLSFWRDTRYAVRLLARSPGFAMVALFTLALGIGGNTAIFSITNALLLRPLPYRDARALVLVTSFDRAQAGRIGCLTFPRYALLATDHRALTAVAAFTNDTANVTGAGEAEQIQIARVSWNFFEVLGARPALGRTFVRADEDGAGVIISDSLWRRRFAGRGDATGQAILLDGHARTVVGVLPPAFTFGLLNSRVDVWLPRVDELSLATRDQIRGGTCYLNAIGRVATGGDVAPAQAEMDLLNARYASEFRGLPDADPRRRMRVEPLRDVLVAGARPLLLTLTAAVVLVLLVACANVAGLVLARALARRREIAVRAALGASRAAIVRQLLIESSVLALAGGFAGLVLGAWAVHGLAAAINDLVARGGEIAAGLDVRVFGFAAALSLVTGVVFGVLPAIETSRANLLALSGTSDVPVGDRVRPLIARRVMVVAQVALTVVLLVTAGLLGRTFWRLSTLDPGFDPADTLTMNLALPRSGYASSREMVAFYEELLAKLQTVPAVESASLASALPVNPSRASPVLIEGQPVVPLAERPIVSVQMVLGPYFRTMKISLVRGRLFDERDIAASAPVVIVNEALARRFFGRANPVGRHITLGRRTVPAEIVGVVRDIRNQALASDPVPEVVVPFTQLAWASMNVIVRTSGAPSAPIRDVRNAITTLDRNLPVTRVQTMEDVLSAARTRPKVLMTVLSLFAATALILATVGVYGFAAHLVSQRSREIGVRLALGAQPGKLVGVIVRQGLVVTAAGIAIGIALSFGVVRLMTSLLYQVDATDALAFSIGPVVPLVAATVAAWVAARRIVRVDPSRTLRAQ